MDAEVAGDLARAHREPDENHVTQVQLRQYGVQVGGEGVVVVARHGLARPAKATAVVGDDAVAGLDQRVGLLLPRLPVQRVTVDQDDRLPRPVVLVVEIDAGRALGADGDGSHGVPSRPSAVCAPGMAQT